MRRLVRPVAFGCAVAAVVVAAALRGDDDRPGAKPRAGHAPSGTTWVRFTDEAGAALAGVECEVRSERAGAEVAPEVRVTDDDVLELPAGAAGTTIDVVASRGPAAARTAEPRPLGHVRVRVPYPAPPELPVPVGPPKAIAGAVVDPDGAAVPGIAVAARCAGAWRHPRPLTAVPGTAWTATTDEKGRFRLDGFGGGAYELTLTVGRDRVTPRPVAVRGGDADVRIALVAARHARVTVVDADGKPVAGAWVQAVTDGPRDATAGAVTPTRDEATTDAAGTAEIGHLPLGARLVLFVGAPAARDDVLPVEQRPWDGADTTVQLARAGVLSGHIRAEGGRTLPEGAVSVVLRDDQGAILGWATADADGAFRIGPLPRGQTGRITARVRGAWGDDVADASADVTTEARDVDLSLDPGAWFAARCPEADREPVFIHVAPSADTRMHWLFAGQPALAVRLDPSRTYTVLAGPTRDGRWGVARDVAPDGRTVELTLAAGAPVAGRVVYAADADVGLGNCRVRATHDGVTIGEVRCDDDGRFLFGSLPAVPLRIEAVGRGPDAPVLASADVVAGATDVVLQPR